VTADRNARTDLTAEFRRAATEIPTKRHRAQSRTNKQHEAYASSSSTPTAAQRQHTTPAPRRQHRQLQQRRVSVASAAFVTYNSSICNQRSNTQNTRQSTIYTEFKSWYNYSDKPQNSRCNY
jgi:hypothetical protein